MINKLKVAITTALKQGVTPQKIVESVTVGMLVGVFPFLGTTTLLALFFGHYLKLNHIVLQAVNYLMYPVQILMIPVYINVVVRVFNLESVNTNLQDLLSLFAQDFWTFLDQFLIIGLYSAALWLIFSVCLYSIINKIFVRFIVQKFFKT